MPDVRISHQGRIQKIEVEKGDFLFHALRQNGIELYSPCGGNGTCGKCKVFIKSEGSVTSCLYPVDEDIDIILPDQREANILVEQHAYTVQLPFYPGNSAELSYYPHGVAIDIGTTTVVLYLVNLVTGGILETRSIVNPQVKYGADVISRINYTALTTDGLITLQREILDAINLQLEHFVKILGITKDEIIKITITGNTTMLHLLLNVDPLPIALAPFKPAFLEEQNLFGEDLKLNCHSRASIKILPSIAAYVGADIVAGIASVKPSKEFQKILFMDIGTNGELALITPEKIWCCATAAGPAFEGANISCGMSAVEGAISSFGANGYSVIGNCEPVGLCGSGLIDVVAWLIDQKLVQSDGLLNEDFVVAKGSIGQKEIMLTQKDIREVQLAKSAIRAGINVLMKKAGLTFDEIDVLFLAGGFGNYVDKTSAITIGMIPAELRNRIISIGNSSGTGAILALKSTFFDHNINNILERSQYIELSEDEDFVLDFVMNMEFEIP
jgi:uncharacterized 2Fe-2S/4Fe-4S cluster protein (DUF4445 family)